MQSNQKKHADCWNFKTLKLSVEIFNLIREETSSHISLGGGGVEHVQYSIRGKTKTRGGQQCIFDFF